MRVPLRGTSCSGPLQDWCPGAHASPLHPCCWKPLQCPLSCLQERHLNLRFPFLRAPLCTLLSRALSFPCSSIRRDMFFVFVFFLAARCCLWDLRGLNPGHDSESAKCQGMFSFLRELLSYSREQSAKDCSVPLKERL